MPALSRPDGTAVRNVPPLRQMMTHLMPTRNEAVVYLEQELDVGPALEYIRRCRDGDPASRVTLFRLLLCGFARMFSMRPHLNRFVVGGTLYQRRHIELSFAVKREFSDDGELASTKLRFRPHEPLGDCAARIGDAVRSAREAPTPVEKETALLTRLPGFILRFLLAAQRFLDRRNLLPHALFRDDPMYASMAFTDTGSVGLGPVFHHPFNYGTVSLFTSIGPVRRQTDARGHTRQTLRIRYAFDERIADGFYLARSLDLLQYCIEHPQVLESDSEVEVSSPPVHDSPHVSG